jgi:hypothetical protein
MSKGKNPPGIIVIVVIVGTAVLGSSLVGFLGSAAYLAYQGRHLRTRLLCETDHQALLDACRQLSQQAMSGKLEPRSYRVRRKPAPEVAQFPEVIRVLQPDHVAIDRIDGHVKVEMFGGWDNFGVYAYPKDFKEPFPFEYRDRELLKGLWYYDDLYKHGRKSEYDKKIDALLSKCGKLVGRN